MWYIGYIFNRLGLVVGFLRWRLKTDVVLALNVCVFLEALMMILVMNAIALLRLTETQTEKPGFV